MPAGNYFKRQSPNNFWRVIQSDYYFNDTKKYPSISNRPSFYEIIRKIPWLTFLAANF